MAEPKARAINEIRIEGKLAFPPEQRQSKTGTTFTTGKLAVDDMKKGERVTYWFGVAAFKDASPVLAGCRKGDRIVVTGKMTVDEWTGKDGQKRVQPIIVVFEAAGIEAPGRQSTESPPTPTDADRHGPSEDDPIPF